MKRKFKRIASLVLAAVMVFAMAMPAMAEEVHSGIKPADMTGHTFTAYQIFSGTQASGEGVQPLGNIEWGSGVDNGASFLAELQEDELIGEAFVSCKTARDVAEAIAENEWTYDSAEANAFARVAYNHRTGAGVAQGSVADAGYYLVVDTTESLTGDNQVVNLALLQFTTQGTFDATTKVDVPKVEKKVLDINDSESTTAGAPQDSADYDIGDDVPFQLTGTVAQNYDDYTTYKFVFHDDQSEGLQLNLDSVAVKIGDQELAKGTEYKVVTDGLSDGCTFEIVFDDLKKVTSKVIAAGDVITVTYTSKLLDSAKKGVEGNPNEVYLEYSNNPNAGGEGDTYTTPKDKVVVFTFDVEVNKQDPEGNALKGAAFALFKKVAAGYTPNTEKGEKLVSAWANETYPDDAKEREKYETYNDYVVVGTYTAGETTTFSFSGLDDGEYVLVETETPAGYNTIEPIEFTITATHDEESDTPGLTDLQVKDKKGEVEGAITFTVTPDTMDKASTNVVNNHGTTLPETGGIGTTIFYVVGSVLVLGAVILLVTKRRMKG